MQVTCLRAAILDIVDSTGVRPGNIVGSFSATLQLLLHTPTKKLAHYFSSSFAYSSLEYGPTPATHAAAAAAYRPSQG